MNTIQYSNRAMDQIAPLIGSLDACPSLATGDATDIHTQPLSSGAVALLDLVIEELPRKQLLDEDMSYVCCNCSSCSCTTSCASCGGCSSCAS
jgi:hypothetical protein